MEEEEKWEDTSAKVDDADVKPVVAEAAADEVASGNPAPTEAPPTKAAPAEAAATKADADDGNNYDCRHLEDLRSL